MADEPGTHLSAMRLRVMRSSGVLRMALLISLLHPRTDKSASSLHAPGSVIWVACMHALAAVTQVLQMCLLRDRRAALHTIPALHGILCAVAAAGFSESAPRESWRW